MNKGPISKIKLGQTTTGATKGVKYLWLLKNDKIRRKYHTNKCYVVMANNGEGWWPMFDGTLADCRNFMAGETVVDIDGGGI